MPSSRLLQALGEQALSEFAAMCPHGLPSVQTARYVAGDCMLESGWSLGVQRRTRFVEEEHFQRGQYTAVWRARESLKEADRFVEEPVLRSGLGKEWQFVKTKTIWEQRMELVCGRVWRVSARYLEPAKLQRGPALHMKPE